MRTELKELVDTLSAVIKSIHQRSYHKLEDKNLYPGQPKILTLIRNHDGITQKELSKLSFVTPATITGMLNKLEANHYVYRVPDETDKRVLRVYLTPEGYDFSMKCEKYMVNMIKQVFDCLDDEELNTYLELTKKVRDNLWNLYES